MQFPLPGVVRDFTHRVHFQCTLGVYFIQLPCAVACIDNFLCAALRSHDLTAVCAVEKSSVYSLKVPCIDSCLCAA